MGPTPSIGNIYYSPYISQLKMTILCFQILEWIDHPNFLRFHTESAKSGLASGHIHHHSQHIGEQPACVSGYGVSEMSGNINEWTASTWSREDIREYGIRADKMPLGWQKGRLGFFPILKGGDWGMEEHEVSCASRNHILPPDEDATGCRLSVLHGRGGGKRSSLMSREPFSSLSARSIYDI